MPCSIKLIERLRNKRFRRNFSWLLSRIDKPAADAAHFVFELVLHFWHAPVMVAGYHDIIDVHGAKKSATQPSFQAVCRSSGGSFLKVLWFMVLVCICSSSQQHEGNYIKAGPIQD